MEIFDEVGVGKHLAHFLFEILYSFIKIFVVKSHSSLLFLCLYLSFFPQIQLFLFTIHFTPLSTNFLNNSWNAIHLLYSYNALSCQFSRTLHLYPNYPIFSNLLRKQYSILQDAYDLIKHV